MNTLQTSTKRWKLPTGYSLQGMRFQQGNQSTSDAKITSIKFPLFSKNQRQQDELFFAVNQDYQSLVGSLNPELNDASRYTVVDFWIDALRVGGIFYPTAESLQTYLSTQDNKSMRLAEPAQLISFFTDDILLQLKRELRGVRSIEDVQRKVSRWFKPKYWEMPEVVDFTTRISKELLEANSTAAQNEVKRKYFSLNEAFFQKNSNLTFYILPNFRHLEDVEISALLWERLQLLGTSELPLSKEHEKELQRLLGFDNNATAFGNFFGNFLAKLTTDPNSVVQEMLKLSGLWVGKEKELELRVYALSNKAKLLQEPKLGNHWGDYRSMLQGKLQSWLTNSLNYLETQGEKKNKLFQDLLILSGCLREGQESSSNPELVLEVRQLIHTLVVQEKDELRRSSQEQSLIFSLLKSKLNILLSKEPVILGFSEEEEKSAREDDKVLKITDKFPGIDNLPLPSLFFGQGKQEKIKRLFTSPKVIKAGFEFSHSLFQLLSIKLHSELELETQQKYAQRLFFLFHKIQSRKLKDTIEGFFQEIDIESVSTLNPQATSFYVSPYHRQRKKIIAFKHFTAEQLNAFHKHIVQVLSDWKKHYSEQNWQELIDSIEVWKFAYASQLQFIEKTNTFHIAPFVEVIKLFPMAESFASAYNYELTTSQLGMFYQQFIAAEVRGAISLISRESFTERSTISILGADRKWKLLVKQEGSELLLRSLPPGVKEGVSTFKTDEVVDKQGLETLKYLPHRWYVDIVDANDKQSAEHMLFINKTGHPIHAGKVSKLFSIQTSKYQLQFLETLLAPTKKTKNLVITYGEPSLIAEQNTTIKWELEGDVLVPKSISREKQRMFINIPFSQKLNEVEQNISPVNYMGIDLGEYGLAYAVLCPSNGQKFGATLVDSGFLFEPQQRAVGAEVAAMKAKQVAGTFGMPSSKLERLRESARQSHKNRIHALSLKHNAWIVYERQVDAFETAGNRVKKLYASIKKGDLYSPLQVDRDLYKRYWGRGIEVEGKSRKQSRGREVNAFATSYFCPKCRRSLLTYIQKNEKYLVQKVRGQQKIFQTSSGGVELLLYLVGMKEEKIELMGSELKSYVKLFARPPLDSEAISYIGINASGKIDKSKRGSQAIFICPFSDCHSACDADIQAAINIAMKSLFYNQNREEDINFFDFVADKKNVAQYPAAFF